MRFRPCIDIHNGKVKQIVGGSLKDQGNQASENFVSEQDASYYAQLYEEQGITGGHGILLNKKGTEFYEEAKRQALLAMAGNITSMAAASRARVPGGPTVISGFSRPLTNWLSSSKNGSPPK